MIQIKNNNGSAVTFDTLVFSKTGVYTYYLSEQIGTNNNIVYDTASYTIKIEVTKSGDYQAAVFYEKDGQAYHGVPAFYNKTKSNGNDTVSIQVNKTWADDNNKKSHRPGSVQVQLYKDGAAYGDAVTLSNLNGWGHSWSGLSKSHTWTVDELNVPEGYTKTVSQKGMNFTITNTNTAGTPNTPNKRINPVSRINWIMYPKQVITLIQTCGAHYSPFPYWAWGQSCLSNVKSTVLLGPNITFFQDSETISFA